MSLYLDAIGSGPTIVLLHGWGMHGGVWAEFARELADNFRVLTPDLPGFGRSRVAWQAGADLPAMVDLIRDALPARATWVGWSLGGLLALAAARRAPDAVDRLVLIGATPRFVQGTDWPCAMAGETLHQFAVDLERDYHATLNRFLSLQVGSGERDLLRQLRAQLLEHGEPHPDALRAGLAILERTDLRGELSAIHAPALVLHGARDRLVPIAAGDHLARQLPCARLVTLETAGHVPFLSHPAPCLSAVREFLHERVN
jgi:pimeloyl-[acyl-carrier protein] methyl ester esterase